MQNNVNQSSLHNLPISRLVAANTSNQPLRLERGKVFLRNFIRNFIRNFNRNFNRNFMRRLFVQYRPI